MIYIGLGALAVAVIALAIVFAPSGNPVELPTPIEAISPTPNDQALFQAVVEVDLELGYEAQIVVDGFPVDAEFIEGTATYRWVPSAADPSITHWTNGEHTVEVYWEKVTGVPEFGSYTWTFRIR